MAIKIGSNFTFQGEQPNFERDRFATKADMKAFPETSIDDGHLSYCMEDKNTYQFKSSNAVDATTGKWRLFKADVDLSAYATKDSVAIDLAKKVDIRGTLISTGATQTSIIKVMTISIPVNYRYRTGFFGITFMCDNEHFMKSLITINTLPSDYVIKVVKSSIHPHLSEKLYYWYDKINNKVILYYSTLRSDNITVKVTDQDAGSEFTWNLDLELGDALPKDAIEAHDINYGNKNLFYATPKNNAGDPKFRAIDIIDLPDLSSKYGTKAEITTINSSITDIKTSLESTQTDFVDLRNKVNAMPKVEFVTQEKYTADKEAGLLDANTIYYIKG